VTSEVTIRDLETHADYAACVALQRDTWGKNFNDAVPASILLVSQKVGGVAAGAFDETGRLLGFVFGITGVHGGDVVHWSDMLAVRPESQNLGLGRRLKEFQRQAVARVGARSIFWTYDPLVARNAHLNFNVFGVRAVEYARDMYGSETGSELHRAIGTDRIVVAWPVDDEELARRKRETTAARDGGDYDNTPVLGDADRPDRKANESVGAGDHLRIAIPLDIAVMQGRDPARAKSWRSSTRAAFESSFVAGYNIEGVTVDAERDRGYYLLARAVPGAEGAVSTTHSKKPSAR
jgi:chorismate synthase